MARRKDVKIGRAPAGWEVAELRSFLERITYGFTNPMPTTEVGPWKLTAADIQDGFINYASARHTSKDAYENMLTDKSRPQVNDVLLTKDGTIGRVAVVDRSPVCINQSVALLKPNLRIEPHFLKYLLSTPYYQRKMAADADGTTILHIYITRVDKMQVAVPGLDEQRRIISVLRGLDSKIELNRRMNETLEAMARAIFKAWFVDFLPVRAKMAARTQTGDPVRAKAEGRLPAPRPNTFYVYVIECDNGTHYIGQTDDLQRRWEDHKAGKVEWTKRHKPVKVAHYEEFSTRQEAVKRESDLKTGFGRKWLKKLIASGRARQAGQPPGMDAESAALFPDSFQDSPVGKIPKGWHTGVLGDLVESLAERVEPRPSKDAERYVALDDMPSRSIDLSVFRSGSEVNSSIIRFTKGDILFGAMRPYFHKVGLAQFGGITRTTTLVLRPKRSEYRHFTLFHLSSEHAVDFATKASVGTTIPYVRWDALAKYEVPVPPVGMMSEFERSLTPITQVICVNGEQARTLAAIRDALLPKLISGSIRVKAAEGPSGSGSTS